MHGLLDCLAFHMAEKYMYFEQSANFTDTDVCGFFIFLSREQRPHSIIAEKLNPKLALHLF